MPVLEQEVHLLELLKHRRLTVHVQDDTANESEEGLAEALRSLGLAFSLEPNVKARDTSHLEELEDHDLAKSPLSLHSTEVLLD